MHLTSEFAMTLMSAKPQASICVGSPSSRSRLMSVVSTAPVAMPSAAR